MVGAGQARGLARGRVRVNLAMVVLGGSTRRFPFIYRTSPGPTHTSAMDPFGKIFSEVERGGASLDDDRRLGRVVAAVSSPALARTIRTSQTLPPRPSRIQVPTLVVIRSEF